MKLDCRKKESTKYFGQFSVFFSFFRQADKERKGRYKKQEETREVERQTIRDKVLFIIFFEFFFLSDFF